MTIASTAVVLVADAIERAERWRGRMIRRAWGDGVAEACALNALIDGAGSFHDCHRADWPSWLPSVVARCYDQDVGAGDEQAAADEWFCELAAILASPVDYHSAHHYFVLALLKSVAERPALAHIVGPTIALHERTLAGDDVTVEEWRIVADDGLAIERAAEYGSAERYAGRAVAVAWPPGIAGAETWWTFYVVVNCGYARDTIGVTPQISGHEHAAQRSMLFAALRAFVEPRPQA